MDLSNYTEYIPPSPKPRQKHKSKPEPAARLGLHLRAFRLYHKITVAEMAENCGINRSTWGYYETERFQASDIVLEKVAEHFGVSVLDLKTWPVVEASGKVKGRPRLSGFTLHIQSQDGREITVDEIMEKVPEGVEDVYVKAEEGRAYWVKGDRAGYVELF